MGIHVTLKMGFNAETFITNIAAKPVYALMASNVFNDSRFSRECVATNRTDQTAIFIIRNDELLILYRRTFGVNFRADNTKVR